MIASRHFRFCSRHSAAVNFAARPEGWRRRFPARWLMVFLFVSGCLLDSLQAAESPALQLAPSAEVTGSGVFLPELIQPNQPLPDVRLCDAPALGKTAELTRAQINHLLAAAAPNWVTTNWTGADAVHISRRTRALKEAAALALLTATLQKNYVKDEGKLELNFTQPWDAPAVPDEPLTVTILELPTAGVTPFFIARFQLCTATETVGTWQATLQAHVWRDVWVAHSDLMRGESVANADITRDRRDVLSVHEALADFAPDDDSLELADSVPANAILLARDVKPRAVIHRGQMADALLQDGALSIMMKVEALEDGAPGQIIHARNPVSQRNLTGKVLNAQTILVSL
jgi:flagella basal body P-ring formation protein FlgA